MHSDCIDALAAALAKAQGAIRGAVKSKINPHFKNAYADLASVYDACREALAANDLAVTQTTDFDGADTWLATTLIHKSGQWIASRYPIRPQGNTPQQYGSAITYARRYSLAAIVGVAAEDEDDDGNAASAPPKRNSAQAKRDGVWERMCAEIEACKTVSALEAWRAQNWSEVLALPSTWQEQVTERYDGQMAAVRPAQAKRTAADRIQSDIGRAQSAEEIQSILDDNADALAKIRDGKPERYDELMQLAFERQELLNPVSA